MTLPKYMRVARQYAWGDVRLERMPVPVPGAGEALLRIGACGVCGSDALSWYVARKTSQGPLVLGHEPAGEIVAIGSGVSAFSPGDRVFTHHHAPCMDCPECRRRLWSGCAVWRESGLEPGGFAEYARISANSLARDTLLLPGAMDYDTATFIEPVACCVRALRRQGRMEPGDVVLIIGLGCMGQLFIHLANAYGAGAVFGSDFVEERRMRAMERGATVVFDPGEVGSHEYRCGGGSPPGQCGPDSVADVVADAVRAATGGRGADLVLVTPGDAAAVQSGIAAAAPGARVVCFTPLPPRQPLSVDAKTLYFREISLVQSYSCGPDETGEALRLLTGGVVEVESLVTHRAGLSGVGPALARAAGKPEGLKTIIHPGQDP